MKRTAVCGLLLIFILNVGWFRVNAASTSGEIGSPSTESKALEMNLGDFILLGKYNNKPILWRCVDIDENGPLIFSDKNLCSKAFNVGEKTEFSVLQINYWGGSDIRSWLISDAEAGNVKWLSGSPPNNYSKEKGFLADGNFTQTERNIIKKVTLKSLLDPENKDLATIGKAGAWNGFKAELMDPSENHCDEISAEFLTEQVFLLDIKQIWNIYQNRDVLGNYLAERPVQKTDDDNEYSSSSTEKIPPYWLRTPYGCKMGNPRDYQYTGRHGLEIGSSVSGLAMYYDYVAAASGIRPAFYLNTDNAMILSGSGTKDDPYVIDGKKKEGIAVYCDGFKVQFDQPPVMENDRVLVPMRKIFEELGAQVSWDDDTQTVTAVRGEETITMQIDNPVITKNGENIELDVPPRLVGERTLVPIRAVAEGLGAKVEWIEEQNQVMITAN